MDILKIMIEKGINLDIPRAVINNESILLWALKNNQMDIAKLLIEKGAAIDKGAFNSRPLDYLVTNKLENLLFSHGEDNNPLWLWHFYNIKANLQEWNENFDEAIKYYKKCLSIPTLGAFEYGATFVNMAISYRCKYILQTSKDEKTIDKSVKLGRLGMLLKQSVGDRDEMPVVLHNFALNVLYKISNVMDLSLCNEVLETTNEALSILDKTKSIKRLGMVLIENYIVKNFLKIDTKDIVTKLEKHLENLTQSELNQLLNIYKEFEKNNKIHKLEFLDKLF